MRQALEVYKKAASSNESLIERAQQALSHVLGSDRILESAEAGSLEAGLSSQRSCNAKGAIAGLYVGSQL